MKQTNKQGKRTEGAQNDTDGHKRNVRVYNIPESRPDEPETGAVSIRKCCKIFTDMVWVPVAESDIESSHRVGNRSTRQD